MSWLFLAPFWWLVCAWAGEFSANRSNARRFTGDWQFLAFLRPDGSGTRIWWPYSDRWEDWGNVNGAVRYFALRARGITGRWVL